MKTKTMKVLTEKDLKKWKRAKSLSDKMEIMEINTRMEKNGKEKKLICIAYGKKHNEVARQTTTWKTGIKFQKLQQLFRETYSGVVS